MDRSTAPHGSLNERVLPSKFFRQATSWGSRDAGLERSHYVSQMHSSQSVAQSYPVLGRLYQWEVSGKVDVHFCRLQVAVISLQVDDE